MLNPTLFEALKTIDPGVTVVNENDPGAFQLQRDMFSFKKTAPVSAHMTDWGEKYHLNCPDCHDTRQRLVVGHRWGTSVALGKSGRAQFSRRMFKCYNENCDVSNTLNKLKLGRGYAGAAVQAASAVKLTADTSVLIRDARFPSPAYLLMSEDTPDHARQYLADRGFDPGTVARAYGLGWCPAGAAYTDEKGAQHTFLEERLLIPIIQHRRLLSWQARRLDGEKKMKYVNETEGCKRYWLYNLDRALMYPDMMLTEGVTNVWRCGADTIACFGHSISQEQLVIMKTVWGFDGRCVICFDEDVWTPNPKTRRVENSDLKYADLMRRMAVFPRGVAVLRLENGDPAVHTYARMRQLKLLASLKATNDPAAGLNAVLWEKDVHEPEPQTPPHPEVVCLGEKQEVAAVGGDEDEDLEGFELGADA